MNWQLIPTIANNRMQYKYDIAKPQKRIHHNYFPADSTCCIYSLGVIPVVSLNARKKVVYELKPHSPANAFRV